MRTCPRCGAPLRPTVEHRRIGDDLPDFATVLWVCIGCGWTADDPSTGDGSPPPEMGDQEE